jgi:acetyl-CoA carboxylase carboxyltransferase component
MLGRKNYKRQELKQSKAAIEKQLAAYKRLVKAIDGNAADTKVASALKAFEPLFFNNMTLVLDRDFVHRLRGVTGKDSNPLNEVELLSDSLMNNEGTLRGNNVIKYAPEESVVKLQIGDPIKLTASEFERLSSAFYAELEQKFLERKARPSSKRARSKVGAR